MESQILHSVRHLDLRSVKENGKKTLNGMLHGRRAAVAHISSVTPGVERPATAGAGSPSGRRYTGAASAAAASGGRVGAQQRREEHAGSEAAAAAAAAAAATSAALAAAEQELQAALARAAQLEGALQGLCTSFAGYVSAAEAGAAAGGGGGGALPQDYFTATFPAGAIGACAREGGGGHMCRGQPPSAPARAWAPARSPAPLTTHPHAHAHPTRHAPPPTHPCARARQA